MQIWLQFSVCVLMVGIAGVKLSRYGDAIADKTGMGGTWVGVVLLATVTSLPELATGVSSVTVAQVPDIAVGDILGSCVFNLVILVVLDSLHRRETIYHDASRGHILAAGFGVMLIAVPGASLMLAATLPMPSIGHVGLYSPMIVLLYVVAMRTVFRYEADQVGSLTEQEPDAYPELSLRGAVLRYVAAAAVVVVAGVWLPFIGEALAHQMGWQESFVGTIFVAFVTSLPEIVVTIAALQLGALDMAIGNLFGSNLFNILILAIDDVLYTKGPLFDHVATIHSVSALSAIMMTGGAIVGLLCRPRSRVLRAIGWVSVFLAAVYIFNTAVLYLDSRTVA